MQFQTCDTSETKQGPGRPKGSVSIMPPRRASRAGEPTLLEKTGVVGSAMLNRLNAGIWAMDGETADKTRKPGTRRLRDLTPEQRRPLESRLYFARRVHKWSEARISHELDLHPDDIGPLAATEGSR